MNIYYRPGMRLIKTAVAVFLCLLFGYLFRMPDMIFSVIAAVVCMQTDVRKSGFTGLNQLLGTLLGGGVGYLAYLLLYGVGWLRSPVQLLVVPACMFLLLYLCNVLEHREICTICCIVFISALEDTTLLPVAVLHHLLYRMLGLSLGIFFAVLLTPMSHKLERKHKKPHSERTECGKSDEID